MKVSIVTISYNQGEYLEQAIRSVIEQNYPDIEYIIVDPGSKDNSQKIIQKYQPQITKIIFEPDRGPADGLNKGFHLATGEILGYLNADDYLLPGAIRQVIDIFTNQTVDVVTGNAIIVGSTGNLIRKTYGRNFSLLDIAYGGAFVIQPSTFFTYNAFAATKGFNIDNNTNWDDELFVDMRLKNKKFMYVNNFFSAYRVHSSSITGAASTDQIQKIKEYHKKRFNKIMKREPSLYDQVMMVLFRYYAKTLNFRDTYERIVRGPIFHRGKS
jgi:glycosyltransferase involved in cell wall biosynthesis